MRHQPAAVRHLQLQEAAEPQKPIDRQLRQLVPSEVSVGYV